MCGSIISSDHPIWKSAKPKTVGADLHGNVTIHCDVCANPNPDYIKWHFREAEIGTGSSLTLSALLEADFGEYRCDVQNTILGKPYTATFQIEVKQRGPPDPPHNVAVLSKTSVSVTLSWIPGYNGGYNDTRLHVSYQASGNDNTYLTQVIDGTRSYLTVDILQSSSVYEFTLTARNSHDGGSESDQTQITVRTNGRW